MSFERRLMFYGQVAGVAQRLGNLRGPSCIRALIDRAFDLDYSDHCLVQRFLE